MEELKPKKLFFGGLFFVLGVIATIFITKYINIFFPDSPAIISTMPDTMRVIHEYKQISNLEAGPNTDKSQSIKYKQKSKQAIERELAYIKDIENNQMNIDSSIKSLKDKLSQQQQVVFEKVYNKIINRVELFPNLKGYHISGQTSDFEFICPNDKSLDYLNLELKFFDKDLVDKIACIYLSVTGKNEADEQTSRYLIYEQAYEVKQGINSIRLRNYLKQKNVEIEIGYLLKKDTQSEFPRFTKVSCHSS